MGDVFQGDYSSLAGFGSQVGRQGQATAQVTSSRYYRSSDGSYKEEPGSYVVGRSVKEAKEGVKQADPRVDPKTGRTSYRSTASYGYNYGTTTRPGVVESPQTIITQTPTVEREPIRVYAYPAGTPQAAVAAATPGQRIVTSRPTDANPYVPGKQTRTDLNPPVVRSAPSTIQEGRPTAPIVDERSPYEKAYQSALPQLAYAGVGDRTPLEGAAIGGAAMVAKSVQNVGSYFSEIGGRTVKGDVSVAPEIALLAAGGVSRRAGTAILGYGGIETIANAGIEGLPQYGSDVLVGVGAFGLGKKTVGAVGKGAIKIAESPFIIANKIAPRSGLPVFIGDRPVGFTVSLPVYESKRTLVVNAKPGAFEILTQRPNELTIIGRKNFPLEQPPVIEVVTSAPITASEKTVRLTPSGELTIGKTEGTGKVRIGETNAIGEAEQILTNPRIGPRSTVSPETVPPFKIELIGTKEPGYSTKYPSRQLPGLFSGKASDSTTPFSETAVIAQYTPKTTTALNEYSLRSKVDLSPSREIQSSLTPRQKAGFFGETKFQFRILQPFEIEPASGQQRTTNVRFRDPLAGFSSTPTSKPPARTGIDYFLRTPKLLSSAPLPKLLEGSEPTGFVFTENPVQPKRSEGKPFSSITAPQESTTQTLGGGGTIQLMKQKVKQKTAEASASLEKVLENVTQKKKTEAKKPITIQVFKETDVKVKTVEKTVEKQKTQPLTLPIVISGSALLEKIISRNKQRQQQALVSISLPATYIATSTVQKQKQSEDLKALLLTPSKSLSPTKQIQPQAQTQPQKQVQPQKLVVLPKQIQRTPQIFTPRGQNNFELKLPKEIRPVVGSKSEKEDNRQKKKERGFQVFGRKGGKEYLVSQQPLVREEAISLGTAYVKSGTQQTFRIRPAGATERGKFSVRQLMNELYTPKSKELRARQAGEEVFTQRSKAKIGTTAEKIQLRLAKIAKRRL